MIFPIREICNIWVLLGPSDRNLVGHVWPEKLLKTIEVWNLSLSSLGEYNGNLEGRSWMRRSNSDLRSIKDLISSYEVALFTMMFSMV